MLQQIRKGMRIRIKIQTFPNCSDCLNAEACLPEKLMINLPAETNSGRVSPLLCSSLSVHQPDVFPRQQQMYRDDDSHFIKALAFPIFLS